MSSQTRIDASKANGAKSQGPITAAGKFNSSQNAIRHGLLAQSVVIRGESPEAFAEFLEDLSALYDPKDIVERSYVETIALCPWRQERFWTIEKCTLEKEERIQLEADPTLAEEDGPSRTADAFRKIADTSRTLDVMSRYQVRFDREYNRALNRLTRKREHEAHLNREKPKENI